MEQRSAEVEKWQKAELGESYDEGILALLYSIRIHRLLWGKNNYFFATTTRIATQVYYCKSTV